MLDAAHRGYDYQDLLIATRLTDVLLGTVVETWIDEKLVSEDRFDDLTTVDLDHRRERTQFKHKDNASLPLPLATFTSDSRDLRLDRLVTCATAEREGPGRGATAHTFRVVLRDARPTDPRLTRVLIPAKQDPGPYVPGMRSLRLSFDPDVLWPLSTGGADNPSGEDTFAFLRDGRLMRTDLLWLCERLIIEVEAPAASFDLINPGPAELLLLERMRRDIGAEAYPNRERTATDVAEALIRSATAARLRRVTVSQEELLRRTRLRHDFGAVARAHPVDSAVEVYRPATVSEVVKRASSAAEEGGVLLLLGPPGQGKSWACHQVVNALKASKWLVAEHYCFLGEADFELQSRVLGEKVFGSLLGRLAEIEPALVTQQRPRFAADENALAESMRRARESQPDRHIALVVDGIDHVTRVLGATTRRVDPSRALAEALASLDLPTGSVLIVLSQPGEHLRPLQDEGATIAMVPAFGTDELRLLAQRLGVLATPGESDRNSGISTEAPGLIDTNDEDVAVDFLNALTERSAGNALYATYLCREALRLPTARVDPAGVIRSLPPFDGTLGAYYEHLIAALDDGSSWVADIVALLDFAVTRVELREIWPEMGHRIDAALDRLAPVLIERATQGGVRVYHESFARFLRQPLRDNPAAAIALLDRVATWLSSKGMFSDARAFRFLLPTLARAGREREVVKLVDVEFTASAVAGGFTATAINANLCTTISCATRIGDWPAVIRCVELARAAGTYEHDNLDSKVVEFADVPMALLGAGAFADRLLYDGRTTMPSRAGLQLCAIVDKAGVAAPWREYMTAFDRESKEDNTAYGPDSQQQVNLAWLRGQLRLAIDSRAASEELPSAKTASGNGVNLINPPKAAVDLSWIETWLGARQLPARPVIDTVCDTLGIETAVELVERLGNPRDFALVLAERLAADGSASSAEAARRWAAPSALQRPIVGTIHRLLALGISINDINHRKIPDAREELFALARKVQEPQADMSPTTIAAWLDSCVIAARQDQLGLATAEALISGPGWYRCWLRFTAALCRAEAQPVGQQGSAAVEALRLLTEDLNPFAGDPRAVDLYSLHGIIASTIRRAIALLDDASWAAAVAILRQVSDGISVTLRGELGGPLPLDLLVELVIHSTTPARRVVSEAFLASVLRENSAAHYYSDLAGFHLSTARLTLAANDKIAAAAQWKTACRLLTAYGWHKDITIYELLDPLPALIAADQRRARERVATAQPLCRRASLHTDGKETRHAPSKWWSLLASVDPEALSKILIPALLRECNMPQERFEDARLDLWRMQHAHADPFIAGALRLTLEPGLEDDDSVEFLRLASLASSGSASTTDLLRLLLARVDERPFRYPFSNSAEMLQRDDEKVDRINRVARQAGLPCVQPAIDDEDRPPADTDRLVSLDTDRRTILERLNDNIPASFGPGATGLGRALRAWQRRPYNTKAPAWARDKFANAIGFRILELASAGRSEDAEATLRTLADGTRFGDTEGLLSALAEGFEVRGFSHLAAMAHTFAWTRSRGHGGWLSFGGKTALESLRRAAAINPAAALSTIAEETQHFIGSYGVSQALILAFASIDFGQFQDQATAVSSLDIAFMAWDEAAAVISARTPRVGPNDDPDYLYIPCTREGNSFDLGSSQEGKSNFPHPESGEVTSGLVVSPDVATPSEPWSVDVALAGAVLAGLAHPSREQKRRTLVAIKMLLAERGELVADVVALALKELSEPATLSWLLRVLETASPPANAVILRCSAQLHTHCRSPHLIVRALARRLLKSVGLNVEMSPSEPDPTLVRLANRNLSIPETVTDIDDFPLDEEETSSFGRDTSVIGDATDSVIQLVEGAAGSRLHQGERFIPGLLHSVQVKVAGAIQNERSKHRLRRQIDKLTSRADPHLPDAFLAPEEIVEDALQRVAAGGRNFLALVGNLVREPDVWEDKLAESLLNDPRLPLGLEVAREPRPAMPFPPGRGASIWRAIRNSATGVTLSAKEKPLWGAAQQEDLLSATVALDAITAVPEVDAGPYYGWKVLASIERRTLNAETWPRKPEGWAMRFCAVVLHGPSAGKALERTPFGKGDASLWWRRLPDDALNGKLQTKSTLVDFDNRSNTVSDGKAGLGWSCFVLVPSASLISALGLRPGATPLQLIDDHGPCIALCTWRSGYNGSEYELRRPSLSGTRLLVRPDAVTRLLGIAPANLVWREYISGRSVLAEPSDKS